jgi:hypothetical protein
MSSKEIKDVMNSLHSLSHDSMNDIVKTLKLEPQELYTVAVQFDLKPGDLTLKDRQLRIKYLKKLLDILNDNVVPIEKLIKNNFEEYNDKEIAYIKNLLIRMCILFIKEAQEIGYKKESKIRTNYITVLFILICMCVLAYFIYKNIKSGKTKR